MSKYQVGDKVTIRKDLKQYIRTEEAQNFPYVADHMLDMAGQTATISQVFLNDEKISNPIYYQLDEHRWWWVEEYFEESKDITISVTASTLEEAYIKFDEAAKEAFNPPRKWTNEENELAMEIVTKRCQRFSNECYQSDQIIFSACIWNDDEEQYETYARILLVNGCWPENAADSNESRVTFVTTSCVGVSYLRYNQPWIGKMFALCDLLDEQPPEWATK